MDVDVDWLIARFDDLSRRHPALSMVILMRPDDLNQVPHDSDRESDMVFPRLNLGKYDLQHCGGGYTTRADGIIAFGLPSYMFPEWTMYNDIGWEHGYWSIWLYRRYGFDPRLDDDCQRISENMECLQAYLPVLELATKFLWHYADNPSEQWFFTACPHHSGDNEFRTCIPWLLSLCDCISGEEIYCSSKVRVRVIKDLGIASMMVLKEMKRFAQTSTDERAVVDSSRTADGFSEDGRTFRWCGRSYSLPENPSKVVRVLYHAYLAGTKYLSEQYIKTEAEVESDIRHIVRDNDLSELIIPEVDSDGKRVKGKWGLMSRTK